MSQISTANAALHTADDMFGDDPDQLRRQMATDALVTANRESTSPDVLDKRRIPRKSIAELNAMDQDEIRELFGRIRRDDRHPAEQVMDILDLPRNSIANIAVGQPTASGVAASIGIPALIGGGLGFLAGGPPGAALGAAVGGGIFGGAAAGAGVARALSSKESRDKVIEQTEGAKGAFGQPEIHTSDVLRAMGVKNRVVSGIVGFAGDVAFDPLTYIGAPGWGATVKAGSKSVNITGPANRAIKRAIAGAASGTPVDSVWGRWLATHPDLTKLAEETTDQAAERIAREVYGAQKSGLIHRGFKMIGANSESTGGRLLGDYDPALLQAAAGEGLSASRLAQIQAARDAIKSSLPGTGKTLRIGVPKDDIGSEVLHVPFSGLFGQPMSVMVPGASSAVRAARMANTLSKIRDLDPAMANIRSGLSAEPYLKAAEISQMEADMADKLGWSTKQQELIGFLRREASINERVRPGEMATVPAPSPRADDEIAAETTGRMVRVKNLDGSYRMAQEWENPSVVTTPPSPQGRLELRDPSAYQENLYAPTPMQDFNAPTGAGGSVVNTMTEAERLASKADTELKAVQAEIDDYARVSESLYQDAKNAMAQPGLFDTADIQTAQDLISQMEAVNHMRKAATLARVRKQNYVNLSTMLGKTRTMSPAKMIETFGNDLAMLVESGVDPAKLEELATMAGRQAELLDEYADSLRLPIEQVAAGDEKMLVMWANRLLNTDDSAMGATMFGRIGNGLRENGQDGWFADTMDNLDRYNRRIFGIRNGHLSRHLSNVASTAAESETHAQIEQELFYRTVKDAVKDAGIDGDKDALQDAATYIRLKQYELKDPKGALYRYYDVTEDMPAPAGDMTVPDFAGAGVKPTPSLLRTELNRMMTTGPLSGPEVRAKLDAAAAKLNAQYDATGEVARANRILNTPMEGYVGPNVMTKEYGDLVREHSKVYNENPTTGPFSNRSTHQIVYYDTIDKKWRKFYEFDRDLLARYPEPPKPELNLSTMDERKIAELGAARKAAGTPAVYDAAGNLQEVPTVPAPPPIGPADAIREKYRQYPEIAEQIVKARENAARYEELAKADPNFRSKWRATPTDVLELNKLANEGRFVALTGGAIPKEGTAAFSLDPGLGIHRYVATHQRMLAKRQALTSLAANARFVDTEQLKLLTGQTEKLVPLNGGGFAKVNGKVRTRDGSEVVGVTINGKRYRTLSPKVRDRNAQLMLGLEGRDIEGALVWEPYAEKFEDVAGVLNEAATPELLSALDKMTVWWKTVTLAHPSWMIFDMVGNTVNAVSSGAKLEHMASPARNNENLKIARYGLRDSDVVKDMTIKAGDATYSASEFAQLAADHHIINNNIAVETMGQFIKQNPGIANATSRTWRKFWGPWFRANQIINDVTRLGAFRSFLDQGYSAEAAADATLRGMFDFADFTHVEREYFRRIIPFYSYMRSNLGYQLSLLMQQPAWANMAPKLRTALEETIAGESAVPETQRPSWMRNNLAAQIQGGDDGFALMLSQGVIPQAEIYNALLPLVGIDGVQKFLHYIVSGMNPVISTPVQIGAGKEFFSGRTIAPSPMGDISPTEFVAGQFRPVGEVGKIADAFGRSPLQGIGRALVGGRLQSMDVERLSSSREREFADEETALRSAIRRADRNGDEDARVDAEVRLLKLYEDMDKVGFKAPKWAKQQLEQIGTP